MNERTLDALTGIVFVIVILGLEYLNLDIGYAKAFIWLFAILFHAYVFGRHTFPKRGWYITAPLGLILLFAVQSTVQTFWFYTGWPLGNISDAWSLAIAMAAAQLSGLSIGSPLLAKPPAEIIETDWTRKRLLLSGLLIIASGLALTFVLWSAWQGRTLTSIRTPWPLLMDGTLPAIVILWIAAGLSAWSVRSAIHTAFHSGLALFGTLSLSPIIYRLGYGFDGFLHLAGEKILMETGLLNPKPFYYIGQYVFTTWLSKMTEIPLPSIDRWLVPVIAAILLPASVAMANRRFASNFGLPLALALLPLGMFVATTPQGFATVLGLAAVILAQGVARQDVRTSASVWLGLWSMAVHPLAGLPLLGVTLAILLASNRTRWASIGSWLAALLAGFSVPVAFYVASNFQSGLQIDWNVGIMAQSSTWLSALTQLNPLTANSYTLWPGWSTVIAAGIPLIATALAVLVLVLVKTERKNSALLMVAAVTLVLSSGLLSQASDFAFLISYERGDYAQRLFQIGELLMVLAAMPALGMLFDRLGRALPLAALAATVFIGSIGAANAYNSLPRHDAAQASRGWSVGKEDVEAVRWIDQFSKGKPYTVLANQTVSSAAVKEFGFKRYAGDVFFYPIPTGGALYNVYLKMTYEDPSFETVKDAAKLGRTDLVFVVINDYWWKAEELNQRIGAIADNTWSIGNGKVNIYVFDTTKARSVETIK